MTRLAHISDIHFGAVDETAAMHLAAHVNNAGVDAVIITGDLTQAGRRREYQAFADYLKEFAAPTLVVPGNHDVPVYNVGHRAADPWRRFRRYVSKDLCPSLSVKDAFILGLNSARRAGPSLDWSLGRLSSKQLAFAAQTLRRAENAALKVVAFHHPVLPGPGRAGQALINRPLRAMNLLSSAGADVLLTGHSHVAQAQVYEGSEQPIIVTAAGTAASTRLRGELPSYNFLAWNDGALSVVTHRYTDDGFMHERSVKFSRETGAWRREQDL